MTQAKCRNPQCGSFRVDEATRYEDRAGKPLHVKGSRGGGCLSLFLLLIMSSVLAVIFSALGIDPWGVASDQTTVEKILAYVILGFAIGVSCCVSLFAKRRRLAVLKSGVRIDCFECIICKYRWEAREGQALDPVIYGASNLLVAGAAKLEEEEADKRRAAEQARQAAWLRQQSRDNDS